MNLEELLKSNRPPKKDEITDEDLAKLFMKYKGLLKQWERDKAFSAATHENIRIASANLDELVETRTAELRKANKQLQQAKARLQHLNLVLRAIRNVNQLIIKEKDRDRLLKGVCDNLIETRGYKSAWIALLDESGKLDTAAQAGLGDDFQPMLDRFKHGKLMHCVRLTKEQSGVFVIQDQSSTCGDCPLAGNYQDRAAATIRLEYEGKVYGLLSTSVPRDLATDEEELGLLHEVAVDIAFALKNLELEEERKQVEERIRFLSSVVEQSADGMAIADLDGNLLFVN